jgi:hypothetical protein
MIKVTITNNEDVYNGIHLMLANYGVVVDEGYVLDVETAITIVAVMNISIDKPEYFPRGKYATIQALNFRIDEALKNSA